MKFSMTMEAPMVISKVEDEAPCWSPRFSPPNSLGWSLGSINFKIFPSRIPLSKVRAIKDDAGHLTFCLGVLSMALQFHIMVKSFAFFLSQRRKDLLNFSSDIQPSPLLNLPLSLSSLQRHIIGKPKPYQNHSD